MCEELQALDDNETWCLAPKQPDMHVTDTKWVFKVKYCADNTTERLKARLVEKREQSKGWY